MFLVLSYKVVHRLAQKWHNHLGDKRGHTSVVHTLGDFHKVFHRKCPLNSTWRWFFSATEVPGWEAIVLEDLEWVGSYLMLAETPLVGQRDTRRTHGVTMTRMKDRVWTLVVSRAHAFTSRRFGPTLNGRKYHFGATITVQLVKGNVGTREAIALVARISTSGGNTSKIVILR